AGERFARASFAFAGEPAELGTSVLRNAVFAGLLNGVLAEKVNLVNAGQIAASRGITVEERTRHRDHGYPNSIEVTVRSAALGSAGGERTVSAEATLIHGSSPRVLRVDGIELEAPLAGTMLFTRSRDVPGVIGQIGTVLGERKVNISTFALGRRGAEHGADAMAMVRLDGEVPESVLEAIRAVPAVTEARLIRLPE
ncbi:MAG: ACT domain-containing protein, partial [Bryobacteraceae bacterium]